MKANYNTPETYGEISGLFDTFEKRKKLVASLNLFDDEFFREVMQNKDAAEYVLRICMDMPDLVIKKIEVQETFSNIVGKSVIVDFVAEDSNGNIYNIEVQSTDKKEYFGPERARLHQSIMDSAFVKKGKTFNNLPKMYIIFLTPFNPLKKFGRNKMVYKTRLVIDGDLDWDCGVYQIYINSAVVTENSKLSDMMQYFLTADPSDKNFGPLSDMVARFKETKEGVDFMCSKFEEQMEKYGGFCETKGIAKGEAKKTLEIVDCLVKKGYDFEGALELIGTDAETYRKYRTLTGDI